MSEPRHLAQIDITTDLILESIVGVLPDGVKPVGVNFDMRKMCFVVTLEHPSFYEVYEGGDIPWTNKRDLALLFKEDKP